MAQKQGLSPKVKNAGRHARRTPKPGDKPISRTKRPTGAPRILQGETLFEQIGKERLSTMPRHYTAGITTVAPKQSQTDLARLIFLEYDAVKVVKTESVRYQSGLALIEQFASAKPTSTANRRVGRLSTALKSAYAALPADITGDPLRLAAAKKGFDLACTALSDAWVELNQSPQA